MFHLFHKREVLIPVLLVILSSSWLKKTIKTDQYTINKIQHTQKVKDQNKNRIWRIMYGNIIFMTRAMYDINHIWYV